MPVRNLVYIVYPARSPAAPGVIWHARRLPAPAVVVEKHAIRTLTRHGCQRLRCCQRQPEMLPSQKAVLLDGAMEDERRLS